MSDFKEQMAQRLMKDIAVVLSLGLKRLTEQAIRGAYQGEGSKCSGANLFSLYE